MSTVKQKQCSRENILLHCSIKARPCRYWEGAACELLRKEELAEFFLWPGDLCGTAQA